MKLFNNIQLSFKKRKLIYKIRRAIYLKINRIRRIIISVIKYVKTELFNLFPLLIAIILTLVIIFLSFLFLDSFPESDLQLSDYGAFISGVSASMVLIWLIYSIHIQTKELVEQNRIRVFTVSSSILSDGRDILNFSIMDIMKTLEVNLPEREVFDPNEAPYTLISAFSTQDMVKISVRPQEDYILNTKMREYISIYNEIEKNLNAIDSERSNLIFLHKSPYSQVYRVFCGLVVDD